MKNPKIILAIISGVLVVGGASAGITAAVMQHRADQPVDAAITTTTEELTTEELTTEPSTERASETQAPPPVKPQPVAPAPPTATPTPPPDAEPDPQEVVWEYDAELSRQLFDEVDRRVRRQPKYNSPITYNADCAEFAKGRLDIITNGVLLYTDHPYTDYRHPKYIMKKCVTDNPITEIVDFWEQSPERIYHSGECAFALFKASNGYYAAIISDLSPFDGQPT